MLSSGIVSYVKSESSVDLLFTAIMLAPRRFKYMVVTMFTSVFEKPDSLCSMPFILSCHSWYYYDSIDDIIGVFAIILHLLFQRKPLLYHLAQCSYRSAYAGYKWAGLASIFIYPNTFFLGL